MLIIQNALLMKLYKIFKKPSPPTTRWWTWEGHLAQDTQVVDQQNTKRSKHREWRNAGFQANDTALFWGWPAWAWGAHCAEGPGTLRTNPPKALLAAPWLGQNPSLGSIFWSAPQILEHMSHLKPYPVPTPYTRAKIHYKHSHFLKIITSAWNQSKYLSLWERVSDSWKSGAI